MEWKCANFPITKYLKRLGSLGEKSDKFAYEGHWQGCHCLDKKIDKPTVVEKRVREFGRGDPYSTVYKLRIPFKHGVLEINIMDTNEAEKER